MRRVIGPPPGWAGEGYGVQWGPCGFRAWMLREREVTWLDWHPDMEAAMNQAERHYDVMNHG